MQTTALVGRYASAVFCVMVSNSTAGPGVDPVDTHPCRHLVQVRGHPQLEAEVVYAARHEYCETATDFLMRRTRLAFVDIDAAESALPRVRHEMTLAF